ncbi:S-layer protein [Thermincola ferriacetica]|uniref:S-layer protein n=1 Tax=Thermincola ferriacetica TaxID=281456 RepID=A0A0L6W4P1_9FIRM|nr:S-layer homology domain-containing protein [Thermincola ferriacetica]KNZ70069.1 S-layer protein [Thermincola ferriacetica]
MRQIRLRRFFTLVICLLLVAAPASANITDVLIYDLSDVEGHWAENQMTHLVAMGIVKGYPSTRYDEQMRAYVPARKLLPNQNITRAEFAVMMFQTLNLIPAAGKASFKDAAKIPSWAREAVNTLYQKEIIYGDTQGNFNPNANIRRAEIAAMVVKGLHDRSPVKQPRSFPDVSDEHWAAEVIQKAADVGIIKGKSNGKFEPNSYATRAEVMTMLYNMLSNDKTQLPDDEELLAVTDAYMAKNEELLNGGAPYDLSPLKEYLTGTEEAALATNADALNEMADRNISLKYEILSKGKVVNKSDWLAQVTYDSKMTVKDADGENVINMTEYVYLMKIDGKWLIYYVPSEPV